MGVFFRDLPDLVLDRSGDGESDGRKQEREQARISMLGDVLLAYKDRVEVDEVQREAVEPETEAEAGIEPEGPQRAEAEGGAAAPGEVVVDDERGEDEDEAAEGAEERDGDALGLDGEESAMAEDGEDAEDHEEGAEGDERDDGVVQGGGFGWGRRRGRRRRKRRRRRRRSAQEARVREEAIAREQSIAHHRQEAPGELSSAERSEKTTECIVHRMSHAYVSYTNTYTTDCIVQRMAATYSIEGPIRRSVLYTV
jgi:hypothetical protein